MDVSIVLTHRCNLDCGYCYAGEHHRTDIDEETLRRSVELLFSDDSKSVQLSFFGGEPFLAFESMKWATELAQKRAAEEGRKLLLQCTTNGSVIKQSHVRFAAEHDMLTVVSIDGIQEAHDLNRPCKGGGSSFEQVRSGLRALCDGGVRTDAMMVISPKTAVHTYLSINYLWSEGIRSVHANVALEQSWSKEDRRELRDQLESVGFELLARRLNGDDVSFEPFEAALERAQRQLRGQSAGSSASEAVQPSSGPRERVVVATGGNLYPCAPMVGDDRDSSPGAALRIGHLDDGAAAIVNRVAQDGVGCDKGGGCECAAYLETGDRKVAGSMGRYYASVCAEVGKMVGETLALQPPPSAQTPRRGKRRAFLLGLGALVGGAALAAPLFATIGAPSPVGKGSVPCSLNDDIGLSPPGAIQPPELPPEPYEEIEILGQMPAPYEPPPPPPPPEVEPETHVRGRMRPPPHRYEP